MNLLVAFSLTFLPATYGGILPSISSHEVGRIVGGEEADIREIPYQVAMLLQRPTGLFGLSCGGVILSPTVVLSAAHCPNVSATGVWRIRAGSNQSESGGQVIPVARTIIHENFTLLRDYDVCLFIPESPIIINGVTTKAIALPPQDMPIPDGTMLLVSGWGTTSEETFPPPDLRKVLAPTVNQDLCRTGYGERLTERMLCAGDFANGGIDACYGDSGGPLASGGLVLGLTSWGNGCARPGYPGVATRVPSFVDWIREKMNSTEAAIVLL